MHYLDDLSRLNFVVDYSYLLIYTNNKQNAHYNRSIDKHFRHINFFKYTNFACSLKTSSVNIFSSRQFSSFSSLISRDLGAHIP